jgi:hypothetical protein
VLRIRVGASVLVLAGLGGCGFIGAGNASHSKPNGFILRGYVQASGGIASTGSACTAPGVTAGAQVRVSDPGGRQLAEGQLGAGVLDPAGHCNFPFELRAVPGGPRTYVVTVGGQPPRPFPATELREDKPAVITVP